MTKNPNRRYGNNIIIATDKEGRAKYWNWHQDCLIDDKTNATGYDSRADANSVIKSIGGKFPGNLWAVELDQPQG